MYGKVVNSREAGNAHSANLAVCIGNGLSYHAVFHWRIFRSMGNKG